MSTINNKNITNVITYTRNGLFNLFAHTRFYLKDNNIVINLLGRVFSNSNIGQ